MVLRNVQVFIETLQVDQGALSHVLLGQLTYSMSYSIRKVV